MAGSIFSEWRQAYYNNSHYSHEFNTLSVNADLGAVGQETGLIDIPNMGRPIFALRFRLHGNCTTDANTVRLATNVFGRAFDIRVIKPDGKYLMNLSANGGIRLHTIAPGGNDVISPGDPIMFSELFTGRGIALADRISGRLGPQTDNGDMYADLIIPVFIPADSGTHKLQLRNANFTWIAGTGTIYATDPGNVPAVSTWTLELISEMLPVGATMTYFGCSSNKTVNLAVGDNFIGNNLSRGKLLKALVLQSALPANVGDLRLVQDGSSLDDSEFEDLVDRTRQLFPDADMFCAGQDYGIEEFGAGAAIVHSPHRNVVVMLPGDLTITDATQLNVTVATAAQLMRIIEVTVEGLPRTATTPEIISTQPAPASPVIQVRQPGVPAPLIRGQPNIGGRPRPGILSGLFQR